jgi:L-alanine-DL-glutamate epimerase-like enolase superfamily enzyme
LSRAGTATAVKAVRARAYTIPTETPEADGTMTWEATTLVLVTADCDGVTGIGWTYAPAATATFVDEVLAPVVVENDPMDVPRAAEAMARAVRNAGRPGAASCAISAVDTALWDLKAKLLGLPLHRLLGAVRDEVPVYGSGGFTTYDDKQLRRQLAGWVHDQQIPRVKIKIAESFGTEVDRDVARMQSSRAAIGPDAELFVDANGGYTAKQAVRVMERVSELDIHWLEEPVSSDDLAGLRAVRESVSPDVTAGEYGFDLAYFYRMCAAGAVDCLQVDVSRCGGITEWLRVAAMAAGFGLEVSGHCAPHLHVGVAAATPNLRHLEWFHDHVRIESALFDGVLDPTGGDIRPRHDEPGLGVAFRDRDAEQFRRG